MITRVRKHYRKKKEEIYPNQDESMWHKLSGFLFYKLEGKRELKIGYHQPPLVS